MVPSLLAFGMSSPSMLLLDSPCMTLTFNFQWILHLLEVWLNWRWMSLTLIYFERQWSSIQFALWYFWRIRSSTEHNIKVCPLHFGFLVFHYIITTNIMYGIIFLFCNLFEDVTVFLSILPTVSFPCGEFELMYHVNNC